MRFRHVIYRETYSILKCLLVIWVCCSVYYLMRMPKTSLPCEKAVSWRRQTQTTRQSDLNSPPSPAYAFKTQEITVKIPISTFGNYSVCNEFEKSYIWKADLQNKYLQEVLTNNTSELKFFPFASYFDDREATDNNGDSNIQVVGMVHRNTMSQIRKLFCILWFDDNSTPYSVRGHGRTIWAYLGPYQSAMVTCPIPSVLHKIPQFITITQTECDIPSNVLPVQNMAFGRRTDGVAVCAKVIYSRPDPVRLIEWVELNHLLGADSIYMYNTSLEGLVNPVLEYYQRVGKVVVKQHPYLSHMARMIYNSSFPTTHYQLNWELEVMSMTDCLYTARERHIVNIDIDEIMHPVAYANHTSPLAAFIAQSGSLEGSEKVASLMFHTAVFTDEFGVDANSSMPGYLHMMRHVTRTTVDWESPKGMVHAHRCLALTHHMCPVPRPGYDTRIEVPESQGYIRHYRHKCRLSGEPNKCKKLLKNPIRDELLWRYKDRLDEQVRPLLKGFGLLNETSVS